MCADNDTDSTTSDEDKLARLAANGDRLALEELLELCAPVAISYACSLLKNKEDALDVAQTALINLAREVSQHWRGGAVLGCLYVLVRNTALNTLSKTARRHKHEAAFIRQSATQPQEGEMAGKPMDRIERAELFDALREELLQLPEETATILAHYHFNGLPVAAIAAKNAISDEACKKRLIRGREELRQRLERRGLTLASLLLLAELLNEFCNSSKVLAAEIDSATIKTMASTAFKAATLATLAAVATKTVYPSSGAAHTAGASNATASTGANCSGIATGADGPLTITKKIWSMVKQHPFAVGGSLLGTAAVTLTVAAAILTGLAYKEAHIIVAPAPSQNSIPNDSTNDSEVPKNITPPAPSLKQSLVINDRTLWIPLHLDPQHGSPDSASFTVKTNQSKALEVNGLLNTKIFTTPVRIKFRCKASGKAEKIFASVFAIQTDTGSTLEFNYAKTLAQQGRMCSQTDISSQKETWIELNITPTGMQSFENGKQTDSMELSTTRVFVGILCKVLNSPEGCTVVIDNVQIKQNIQNPLDTDF